MTESRQPRLGVPVSLGLPVRTAERFLQRGTVTENEEVGLLIVVAVVLASVSVLVQAYLPLNSQTGKQGNFVWLYINM